MRYRPLDANGDYVIGQPFLKDSPACVAQAVVTRLGLWTGEWFLDTSEGTPWGTQILGKHSIANADAYIKQRILSTPGVTSLVSYASTYDGTSRRITISCLINTLYGAAPVQGTF